MNKKITIIILVFFTVFLSVFLAIGVYKYNKLRSRNFSESEQIQSVLESEQTKNVFSLNENKQIKDIFLQSGGKINQNNAVEINNIKVSGSIISFNKDGKIIEIFSSELKKKIFISYFEETTFYINKNMMDEQYKRAVIDYEQKQKETAGEIEELKKENSGGGVALPIMPNQNFYQQVNGIENLNIKKNDILTVIGNYNESSNKITALSLIKTE